MGGGPSDKPVGEPPAVGALQWLADWLGAARQQALVSEVGMDSTAQNGLGQDLRAEMAVLNSPRICGVCGRPKHGQSLICNQRFDEEDRSWTCPQCGRSGQIRTYVTDAGIRIWEHADGGICSEPNHLQYWARESDRLREQERDRIEREALRPIETRSIEEQQRERERRIAADRESARRANAAAGIDRIAMAGAGAITSLSQQALVGPERSLAGPDWGTQRGNAVWDAIVRHHEEPPKPKKLPIVKPTKRVFNFKDG